MVFAITNQKGGVGKTTTVLNLGVYLAVQGKKVLLVDIDPQANLTSGLGISRHDGAEYSTTYDLFVNKTKATDLVKETKTPKLHILPSGIELAGAEVEIVGAFSRESILKKAIEEVKENYDYILIDCPPSLGLLTINGLVCAEHILIPVQAEYFALEGLGQLINTIKLIKSNLNQQLDIGGVILTMFDNRTNLSKDVTSEIRKHFDDKVFNSYIPRNVKLSEAPSHGLSIYEYAPQSSGAKAYEAITLEIIERFDKGKLVRPLLGKKE